MILSDPLFQALFTSALPKIIVKANAPKFTVVQSNEAYKLAINLDGHDLSGRSLKDVFDPTSSTLLIKALTEAQHSNKAVLISLSESPARQPAVCQSEIIPLGGNQQKPEYLLIAMQDMAGIALKQQAIDEGLERERILNEELTAEKAALNRLVDELRSSQEKLFNLNQTLEDQFKHRTEELRASEARFRNLVEQAPVAIALLSGEGLVVGAANPKILTIWGKDEHQVMGKPILEALPEMEGQVYPQILKQVFETGIPYEGKEAEVDLIRNNIRETGYFNFINYPIRAAAGNIEGVMVVATEVTGQVLAKKRTEESERNLHDLIMRARYPLMILRGREWVVEIANQQIADLWATPLSQITGRRLLDILPELADQPFPELLSRVYTSGEAYGQEEESFYLKSAEGPVEKFVSFHYDPLFDDHQKVVGIIVSANDITDVVRSRHLLEESNRQQKVLNEELEDANEELAAANEELAASNEELIQSQEALLNTNRDLSESELRFRHLVQQAPVAISILRGRELIIETANDQVLRIWGKKQNIIGKALHNALPELRGQHFLNVLDDIFKTGEAYYGNEEKALLDHDGELLEGYYNFIFQPIKNELGETGAIMIVGIDITDQVNAKKELERVYEQASLSKKAAELGTFDMDLIKGTMEWDARCRELFGISHQKPVSYEHDFVPGLHEADRERVTALIESLFDKEISNGEYDVEYRTVGMEDGRLRWVRAKGKVFFNERDEPVRFIGSVLDITDQKRDEQRKNDFIGMVSHELKTPLTSLKAYIQLLHRAAIGHQDTSALKALSQAEKQIKKMTNMISGFLNLSRLESGKLYLDLADVNLNALIQEVIDDMKITVPGHTFAFRPSGAIHTQVDIEKIIHVISNLLSNAVKYSQDGGFIEISTELNKDFVIVTIKDDGIGIDSNHLDKLFDRYYRVERTNTRYISGFGIGLYLCAEIIHLHNGRIWVESEVGHGSTFYFSLPII